MHRLWLLIVFPLCIFANAIEQKEVVIIGSGPAGYTAALYSARANLQPFVFEGRVFNIPGGQLVSTTSIENYPGFPDGVGGWQLIKEFRRQAQQFGAEMVSDDVVQVDLSKYPFLVVGKTHKVLAKSIIIATGAKAKRLSVKGTRDSEFWNRGVSACAVCDGPLPMFRDKSVFVVGGGDSAMSEALFLTNFASRVFIVHRREKLRASKIMQQRVFEHPKIEVFYNKVLSEVLGDAVLRKVILEDVHTKQKETFSAGGVFLAIGHEPATSFLHKQVKMDDQGYIVVEKGSTRTSIQGVFAAGDVQDHTYRQAITAAGSGCMAALDAAKFLQMQKEEHEE